MEVPRRRRRALQQSGTFRLFLVFATLVGINVYVFFYSPERLHVVAEAAETATVGRRAKVTEAVPAGEKLITTQGVVREKEGLGAALRREGLATADVDGTLRALRPLLDFKRDLRGGQKYTLRRGTGGRLVVMELRAGGTIVAVHRSPDGKLLGGKAGLAKARRVIHH